MIGVALPVAISQTIAAIGTSIHLLYLDRFFSTRPTNSILVHPPTNIPFYRLPCASLYSHPVALAADAKVLSYQRAGNHG